MKKIIQLISTMNLGGAETMVKDYALLMDKEKVDITIISFGPHYDSVNERALKEHGINVIFLSELLYKKDKKINIFQKAIRYISRFYYLRKIICREKPDIIHAHLYVGMYFRFLPLKRLNAKLYYTVHNVPERFFDKKLRINEKYIGYKEINRLIKKYNMTLIALHDDMNKELREIFHTKQVVTVNNGIVLDRFKPELYNREKVRQSLGIPFDDFLIGNVGRFHIQKNHEFMIRVFRELLKERPNARLLFIGHGASKEEIRIQVREWGIEDRVIFLENRDDIPQLMKAMDVFFFPSRWEGFGNVLIEAQSMQLRCVVSECVPNSVKLTDLVVTKNLNDKIEDWVETLLEKSNAKDIGQKLEKYNMKNCAMKLQQIYLEQNESN